MNLKNNIQKISAFFITIFLLILGYTAGDYWILLLTASIFLTIATWGLNIVSGMAGQISLAHGFFVAVGTYTAAVLGGISTEILANLGVSRTFQNIELFENMTTLDNILIGAHRHIDYGSIAGLLFSKKARKEEEKARKIAEDIIDFLEIEEYRYSYILSLPYGIQKRIELARALAMKPKVLLLDEPAAGMNNEETEDIARFILDIHEELYLTSCAGFVGYKPTVMLCIA